MKEAHGWEEKMGTFTSAPHFLIHTHTHTHTFSQASVGYCSVLALERQG